MSFLRRARRQGGAARTSDEFLLSHDEVLSPAHAGGPVPCIETASAMYEAMGSGPTVISSPITASTYDAHTGRIVENTLRIAYVRVATSGFALELLQPDRDNPAAPQTRLLLERCGMNHVAYWTADLERSVRTSLERGARVVLASTADGERARHLLHQFGFKGLLPELRSCYIEVQGVGLIEFVATAQWIIDLPALFGPEIQQIVPAPAT